VPFLLETDGIGHAMDIAPHDWLRDLRSFVGRRCGDALLLGEVNLEYEDVRRFFGSDGREELHMCLNFNLNQALALALVRQDAGTLVHDLRAMPSLSADDGWANFVRNHDEWSLDKLTAAERQEVFAEFGLKEEMQLFGRGLRRRLPTMMKGDPARIRMAYSLAFSLPGTPVLFYGEEIGMSENLAIPGRLSVRAPMQWKSDRNGGFSTAPPDRLCRPVVEGRKWGPQAVNVADQQRDPNSLLNWMERLIRRRRETPEIVFGHWSFVPVSDAAVLAMRYDWGSRILIVIHNLAERGCKVAFELEHASGAALIDHFGAGAFSLSKNGSAMVELEGYGFRWLRLDLVG
jgi:glycosidase